MPIIPECKGCHERRVKMIAAGNALVEWIKNPRGAPPHMMQPPRPQPNSFPTEKEQVKTEQEG
jgi:hypothetical protein